MKWVIVALGVILLAGGVAGLAHPVITYHQKEEVAKLGPIQATVDKEKTVEIPMPVSVAAIAAGLVLVVAGARRKA
jgi:hypothetical protein